MFSNLEAFQVSSSSLPLTKDVSFGNYADPLFKVIDLKDYLC